MRLRRLDLALLLALSPAAWAAEGMWTLDNLPKAELKKKYGFEPDAAWVDKVMKSSVRLAGGCSGSFVSKDGLVLTNHHCVIGCVQQLSSEKKDYVADGFLAKSRAEELACPQMEINRLEQITDITARLNQATKGASGAEYARLQRAEKSKIEAECVAGAADTTRCDVVELYHGGAYNLYKYRRFQDVRLAFAPEQAIAFFGGDPDNFNFPRYDLDMPMSASAASATTRGPSVRVALPTMRVSSGTAPRCRIDPSVAISSLRTESSLRLRSATSSSPIEASPIFRRARTLSNRRPSSRPSRTTRTRSGTAGVARRIPSPRMAVLRIPRSGSMMRALSAAITTGSTGTSGSMTSSRSGVGASMIRSPSLVRTAPMPLVRGRWRLTSDATARARMSPCISVENSTNPGSARMSSMRSSASSTSRRTASTGSCASGTRSGVAA